FVSHPHCQQLLTSIWYEGFPGRQQRGSAWNIIVCIALIILWPVLAICYIVGGGTTRASDRGPPPTFIESLVVAWVLASLGSSTCSRLIRTSDRYRYYDPDTPVCMTPDDCTLESNVFSSIADSYLTLLWSLFSITKVEDTDVAEVGAD
ncbi:hypothetical protein OSTOST_12574, partial [Ostertagia ostertagi]